MGTGRRPVTFPKTWLRQPGPGMVRLQVAATNHRGPCATPPVSTSLPSTRRANATPPSPSELTDTSRAFRRLGST